MEKVKISSLEPLLKLTGSTDPTSITLDAAVLSCGCVVSESYFLSLIDAIGTGTCPECLTPSVSFLKPLHQLRDLYNIISQVQTDSRSRRRSSSKKSIKDSEKGELMDLVSLFYKYAKEETAPDKKSSKDSKVSSTTDLGPIDIKYKSTSDLGYINSTSISPLQYAGYSPGDSLNVSHERTRSKASKYESFLIADLSEEKEYNFSKCFPFYRKLYTFPTQQGKLFSTNMFKGAVMKKGPRFNSSDINTFIDHRTGQEVSRFVLMTEKKWELYELSKELEYKPVLICCGKLTGEYGQSFESMRENYREEVLIRNDFTGNNQTSDTSSASDRKKRLSLWEQLSCKLSPDFLVISGTKGVMRVLNVSKASLPHELGQPVYTYITNFPIRCIAASQSDPIIACGITAKERISGKEQPFVVLHKLIRSNLASKIIGSVEPITITIPYRDPIKLINFNLSSTHILCCTVWESRYFIVRLRGAGSDNFKKPRLIWTDSSAPRKKRKDGMLYEDSDGDEEDDALMMDNEGITDAQFGVIPNTVILTFCSLLRRPPIMFRLEGSTIDSSNRQLSDAISIESSANSRVGDEETDISNIKSSELLLRFQEIGFSIHKVALLPRRDAMVFLDKDGKVYLVSIPHFEINLNASPKKVAVLLGDVSNAERYIEAAAITFSPDGGKVYVADRKGNFLVFDFTKGVPGIDADVVKCRIISA